MEASFLLLRLDRHDLKSAVHLRRRQPDAVVLPHGLDHIVDQALDVRRLDVLHRLGGDPQNRVAQVGDFQDGHGLILFHAGS